MGQIIDLTASDGQIIRAWRADPPAGLAVRGGLIVGQELFGVNTHLRYVCERYAAFGYVSIAPCFYDRAQPGGFEAGYSQAELEAARVALGKLDIEKMMLDCDGALDVLAPFGKSGIVGYCSGGGTAWYAACTLDRIACGISYYGGRVVTYADKTPKCPFMLHWGETDHTIPLSAVRDVEAKHPEAQSFVYPVAGHGFNCDLRAAFHAEASAQAWDRTLAFLREKIG